MQTLTFKRGDDGLGTEAELADEKGATDLSDATVTFHFGGHELRADVIDAEKGIVQIYLDKYHTSRTGTFRGLFKVVYPDYRVERFPTKGYLFITIEESEEGGL